MKPIPDKVTFGFFSFTEITDPAAHRSYNEWHQLDHLPEQFPLPGIAYGQRWVSTPACRDARAVSGPDLDPIHYVTCYLMSEPIEQTLDDFFALGAELHHLDRFHSDRHAHLTGPFRVGAAAAAPRALVSAAAVPYRAHRGVYAIVEEAGSAGGDLAPALLGVAGVAGVWSFASVAGMTSRRWTSGERRITLCWLDDDPLQVAARLVPIVGTLSATFAGPFETITPWQWDWFDPK
jgi:hypothetical protein